MASLLRTAAVISCVLVALGFLLFATDEAQKDSQQQLAKVNGAIDRPAPSSADEQMRERRHGPAREAIDDANDVLLVPFAGLISPHSDPWMQRTVPAGLGLLAYGLGLTVLANYLPKPRTGSTDWRDAGFTR